MAIDFNTLFSRPEAASTRPSNPSPIAAARNDFRSLVLALQSGDVDGALRALDAVREDLSGPAKVASPQGQAHAKGSQSVNDALDVLAQALYARDRTPPESTPATSQSIDYTKYSSMTPYEVQIANPNGLPAGWDWSAWAETAGKPHPDTVDASGAPIEPASTASAEAFDRAGSAFDWNRTGAWLAREGTDGSTHTMTVNPPAGWSGSLELASGQVASSLGSVSAVKFVVTNAAGRVLYASNGFESAAGTDCRFRAEGSEGPLTITATYQGAGRQSFNCLHMP